MKVLNARTIRAGFYAAMLVLGIIMAFQQVQNGNESQFFTVIAIVSLILLIEIYATWAFYKLNHQQVSLRLNKKYDIVVHWAHHLILPMLSFYGGALFIFFNRSTDIRWTLYLVNFAVYSALFYNLRSYFEHDQDKEKLSHYVYDVLKLYMFFVLNNIVLNITIDSDWKIFWVPLVNLVLTSMFTLFSISRKRQAHSQNQLISIMVGIFVAFASLLSLSFVQFNLLEQSFLNLLFFYFGNAIFHHKLDNSLKPAIIIEYLVVLVIVINIFLSLG